MKNRLLSVCALILLLSPLCARAEEQPVVINLVEDASQDYRFKRRCASAGNRLSPRHLLRLRHSAL